MFSYGKPCEIAENILLRSSLAIELGLDINADISDHAWLLLKKIWDCAWELRRREIQFQDKDFGSLGGHGGSYVKQFMLTVAEYGEKTKLFNRKRINDYHTFSFEKIKLFDVYLFWKGFYLQSVIEYFQGQLDTRQEELLIQKKTDELFGNSRISSDEKMDTWEEIDGAFYPSDLI